MKIKNLIRIFALIILLAIGPTMLFSACTGNNSSKNAYTPINEKRDISEGFSAFLPSVTYGIHDITMDNKSGLLYVADKDKVIEINRKHEERILITGLDNCKKITACSNKIFILEQGDEKISLKIFDMKGSLLNELEFDENIIGIVNKMQVLDKNGNKLAFHVSKDIQRNIAVLDVKSGELKELDFRDVCCFCSYGENKLYIVTWGSPYTLSLYDVENNSVIKSTRFTLSLFFDLVYNEKYKTLYC